MKRITGKYGKLKAATDHLATIDGIDYRIAPIDGAIVLAFDHENGIVVSTGFYEIDDFTTSRIMGKDITSDYHEMVLESIRHEIKQDTRDNAAADAYAERNHP